MQNKKNPLTSKIFDNFYPDLTKNISNTLIASLGGPNSSLLRALNMNSNLQAATSKCVLPTLPPTTNFLAKEMETIKSSLSNLNNPVLTLSHNYQKNCFSMLNSPSYLKLINPKTLVPASSITQLVHTASITDTLNSFKYDHMIKSARDSMKIYQNTFDAQKFMPKFPKELFQGIAKDQIMAVAIQYQPIDFRIPNLTEEIIDRTEEIMTYEGTSVLNEPPKEMIIPEAEIQDEKEQPDIYYGELLDIITGWIKSALDEKLDKKIQVNGKTVKTSTFLHAYPNFVKNTIFVLLFTYMLMSGFNNIYDFGDRIIHILKMFLDLLN